MTKFLLRTFFILSVLLFGVLFGIHQANEGTLSLFGKNEGAHPITVPSSSPDQGEQKQEVTFKQAVPAPEKDQLVEKPENSTKDLEDKQQLAADVGAFNFYSELGSNIGELLEIVVYHTVSAITSMIDGWLNN
ncbi:DUF3679 domain-containing protein [Alkalihalobacillus sp. BA299]|uniref:DUF3679 domain-containing protein n=1 Tax=Alkalihalobacillus sp. BA299 TaxID=2815938 RepID=UPI001ADD3A92|nr:DUF3679 domain-containing protein [Alkalihalobacillus sp. BA299]